MVAGNVRANDQEMLVLASQSLRGYQRRPRRKRKKSKKREADATESSESSEPAIITVESLQRNRRRRRIPSSSPDIEILPSADRSRSRSRTSRTTAPHEISARRKTASRSRRAQNEQDIDEKLNDDDDDYDDEDEDDADNIGNYHHSGNFNNNFECETTEDDDEEKAQQKKKKKPKKLEIQARRIKAIIPGFRSQLKRLNIPEDQWYEPKYFHADTFGPRLKEVWEANLGIKCKWMVIKKEAGGDIPVRQMKDDGDYHYNVFYATVSKVTRVEPRSLEIDGIKVSLKLKWVRDADDDGTAWHWEGREKEFREFMVYVFKYDSTDTMWNEKIFWKFGTVLNKYKTFEEIKKWFENKITRSRRVTDAVINDYEEGDDFYDIRRKHPVYAFRNKRYCKEWERDRNKLRVLKRPALNLIEVTDEFNNPQKILLNWMNTALVLGVTKKGTSWLHLWGPSNNKKTFFIIKAIYDLLPTGKMVFNEKGWPEGFEENKYFVLWVDGLRKSTIERGFDAQMMEHGTVGTDSYWTFPVKFGVDPPRTRGEVWITTGNAPMQDLVSQEVYDSIVCNRVTEIEYKDEWMHTMQIINHVRAAQNLEPALEPPVHRPPSWRASRDPLNGGMDCGSDIAQDYINMNEQELEQKNNERLQGLVDKITYLDEDMNLLCESIQSIHSDGGNDLWWWVCEQRQEQTLHQAAVVLKAIHGVNARCFEGILNEHEWAQRVWYSYQNNAFGSDDDKLSKLKDVDPNEEVHVFGAFLDF